MKMMTLIDRIRTIREENPTLFCAMASAVLGTLAIIGHFLSGSTVVLISLVVAVIFSTKYNFKILKIKKADNTNLVKLQENEFDEFLPEVNESNMSLLERASDQSSAALPAEEGEEKSEEIPSFLMIPDCIPEIDENSTDEDDALGIGVPDEIIERNRSAEIEFKKSHFKKDSSVSTSSSSDEENLSKGLKFPDHSSNVVDHGSSHIKKIELNPQMQQSLIMSSTLLPSLVTGLVSWAGGGAAANDNTFMKSEPHRVVHDDNNRTYSDEEDESDYEIVNTEEYQ
ncbi:uncharacterized protein LOC129946365 isoform X2 [Eupeodes corollae]|nr:uncharacterized protein LOC129946365 isoform X2 [Eupeodes corollae]